MCALVVCVVSVHTSLVGCASRQSGAGYEQRPQALARITRDELEPLRHPVESSTAYVERAAERLSARPSDYSAIGEQSEESLDQLGHWWDAVVGRPERTNVGTGQARH